MKTKLLTLALAALAASALPIAAQQLPDPATPSREHRAIWMSPMLNYTWPSGSITSPNAEARRKSLVNDLQKLREYGINTIYYHVRANCDATYASSYEPYASNVASVRGGQPAFDPFGYLVETAHELGIEVYAWVNPYRYSANGNYGPGERNYENSHPDWLITTPTRMFLNPGVPEVQDRIEAIIKEIATNYDIDGLIFDDYFYSSDVSADDDAKEFGLYGGGLDLAPWRRKNVDETVRRAYEAVKAARPYAVFAIGPAGRISPPDIANYSLEPAPHGDMQYDDLFADPIKWLSKGWLDFLSPQIYWPDKYDDLVDWYSVAVPHFGRHCYTSVDVSRLKTHKAAEYLREIEYVRKQIRPNENGAVFFDYGAFTNYKEKVDGAYASWGTILANERFTGPTLQPIHPWRGTYSGSTVSNVRREGSKLLWDGPADADRRRYTIYAVPAAEATDAFASDRSKLAAVRYTESYEIPADAADMRYAVAVYDRYGNEYAPLFEGATAGTVAAPAVVAPAEGAVMPDLFDFEWTAAPGRYIVEVATDREFSNTIARTECTSTRIPGTYVADFEGGNEYFWRVRVLQANGAENVSAPVGFTPTRISVLSPTTTQTGVGLCPEITWTAAGEGTEYLMEISSVRNFSNLVYVATSTAPRLIVPRYTLKSGSEYFVRVTGARYGSRSVSATVAFSTLDRDDYAAPEIANPATDGQMMYSNDCIRVAPWEGMGNVAVEVSETTSFPARSIYTGTLSDFATEGRPLGEIKVASKKLVDGKTYYVRCRGTYSLTTSTASKRTDYGPVRSFVYSSGTGVAEVEAEDAMHIDGTTLHVPQGTRRVDVYDAAGRCVLSHTSCPATIELGSLAAGAYVIHASGKNTSTLKWVK